MPDDGGDERTRRLLEMSYFLWTVVIPRWGELASHTEAVLVVSEVFFPLCRRLVRPLVTKYNHGDLLLSSASRGMERVCREIVEVSREMSPGLAGAALQRAAAGGHLSLARFLESLVPWVERSLLDETHRYAFASACRGGHLEVARWLVGSSGVTRETVAGALVLACSGAHTHVASWILDTRDCVDVVPVAAKALVECVRSGDAVMAQRLLPIVSCNATGRAFWLAGMCAAVEGNQLASGKWFLTTFQPDVRSISSERKLKDTTGDAFRKGHLQVVRWAVEILNVDPWLPHERINELISVIGDEKLECQKWLADFYNVQTDDVNGPILLKAVWQCCGTGNLRSAQWLVDRFSLQKQASFASGAAETMALCCADNALVSSAMWLAKSTAITTAQLEEHRVFNVALENGCLETFQRLAEHYQLGRGQVLAWRCLSSACYSGSLEALQFLCDRFGLGITELSWSAEAAMLFTANHRDHSLIEWMLARGVSPSSLEPFVGDCLTAERTPQTPQVA